MRRLLSAFMAFCLFNVSVYGAVAKLADEEVERQHYTVDVTPQQPHLQKSVYTSTKNLVFGLQAKTFEYLKSIHYFIKSHPIIWIPLAIVSITALHISIISIVMDCILGTFPGSSISPNFEGIYYWFTHSSNHYKVLDYTPDYSQASALQSVLVQRDSWKATPHLTLLEALQVWFNSANNILALASGITMQYLYHEDPSPQALQAFSNAAAAVFSTHLVAPLDKDIACDLTIGVESGRDWLSNCKEVTHLMNQHTINVTADAQLWFLLKKRRFSVAHLIPKTSPHTARYPQLDMSPDYNNVDHHVRSFARRRLLQLDNTLTLPEAIKEWLSNALHWMNQASSMADLLRNRMCPLPAENTELNDITLRVFDAQQAILNATVRCDFDIRQDALQLKDCAFDTTPTNYNHDTRCDMNAHMSFPQDGAIWLSPNVANLYHTFLMVARQLVAPTPLPTLAPLVPTLQPTTLAPNTANPTTPQPTTLAPTPKPHTHTKTLPRHTATHSASHSLEAPARSTTTRLYWANQAANEIWVAEVNQIDGRSINPRVFLRNIPNPNSIFVDEKYKKLYWANPAQKNIMVADLNNFTGIPFIANSRVFIPINSYGIYFDSDENMFYFQPVPKTLPMQLSCFQIDPTNPTFNPNFRNYSYPDSSGAYGMVVIGSEVYSFVLNGVAQIAISVINDTTSIVDDRYVLTNISNPDLSTPLYLVGVALDKMNNLMFWRDNRQAINVARYKPGTRPSFLTPFISFYTNVSGTYGGLSVPSY